MNDLSLAYSPGVAEPCLEIKKESIRYYFYNELLNFSIPSMLTARLRSVWIVEIKIFYPNVSKYRIFLMKIPHVY